MMKITQVITENLIEFEHFLLNWKYFGFDLLKLSLILSISWWICGIVFVLDEFETVTVVSVTEEVC
jgi:hypothetical protein